MTTKEEEDDLWKINILEAEGQHGVQGPNVENLDILEPLNTRQVNIGSNAKHKFAKIEDYWDEYKVDKVVELLPKYKDLLPTNFLDLKGTVRDLGVMKITLKPDAKLMKQRHY